MSCRRSVSRSGWSRTRASARRRRHRAGRARDPPRFLPPGRRAGLLEAADLGLRELLERELCQRGAAPQRQCPLEELTPFLCSRLRASPRARTVSRRPARVRRGDVSRGARFQDVGPELRRSLESSSAARSWRSSAPPHPETRSTSRSVATTLPASRKSAARSARCFWPPSATGRTPPRPRGGPECGAQALAISLTKPRFCIGAAVPVEHTSASSGNRSAGGSEATRSRPAQDVAVGEPLAAVSPRLGPLHRAAHVDRTEHLSREGVASLAIPLVAPLRGPGLQSTAAAGSSGEGCTAHTAGR